MVFKESEKLPDAVCLHIACCMVGLSAQDQEGQVLASERLERCQNLIHFATEWEKRWVEAMRFWYAKDYEFAARAFEAITQDWPEDILAIKAAEFLYYTLGQHFSGPRFRSHVERVAEVLGGHPGFEASRSFAHELCGDMAGARKWAEVALSFDPEQAWAHHSLAHVLLWEGDTEEAVRLHKEWLPMWERSNRVIQCHNAWHTALMYVDRLAFEDAWAIYREVIWGRNPDATGEQVDAVALLWRMELAGEPVSSAAWKDIARHTERRCFELFTPFVTAHDIYCLRRAGSTEAASELLDAVDRRAQAEDAEAVRVWSTVGRSTVMASDRLAAQDFSSASQLFGRSISRVAEVGGSDAQDDLFRFSYLESLRRSGQKAEARNYLEQRLREKKPSELESHLLGALD